MATKEWEPPKSYRKTVTLSGGKAEVRVSHGFDTVDAKVKVYGHYHRVPGSNGKNKIMTVKVRVPSTSVRLKLGDQVLKARSCCKPPDVFDERTGIAYALERLISDGQKQRIFNTADRKVIMTAILPPVPKVTYVRKSPSFGKRLKNLEEIVSRLATVPVPVAAAAVAAAPADSTSKIAAAPRKVLAGE